ncbi:MAG: M48 family metalloprotease [Candidatus Binatia bacterium]
MPALRCFVPPELTADLLAEEGRKQKELAVELYHRRQLRLARVARRLRVDGAGLCGGRTVPYYGALIRSRRDINEEFRDAATAVLGLGEGLTVEMVVEGGAAERAGLREGDRVLAINGEAASKREDLGRLLARVEDGRARFSVERDGTGMDVIVEAEKACAYPVGLQIQDAVNAFADGRAVVVTTGMLRFVENDDELAQVVAHEISHNVLSHVHKQQGNYLLGRILGALLDVGAQSAGVNTGRTGEALGASIGAGMASKGFEAEADYLGAYMAARAGFDISVAPTLWRRMAVEHPSSIAGGFMASHPSTPERALALEETIEEILAKRDRGEALEPARIDDASRR